MSTLFSRALDPRLLLTLCLLPSAARAQERADKPQVFCEPSRAVALVREQLSEAKGFADPVKRIAVMTRAADLLWAREQAQARAVFAEAFELASRHFRERGDEVRREQGRADSRVPALTVRLPDQRFVVLRAVAQRDAAWASELAARAAEETRAEAKKDEAAGGERRPVGEKLLSFAESLLEGDAGVALTVARTSFADPATMYLPHFLYKLAESNRAAADAFFKEALAAYADRDVNSLLYLSGYPFGQTAAIAPVMPYMGVARPVGFEADPELQRLFVNTFLGFAERRLAALAQQPPAEELAYRRSEPEAIYTALRGLAFLYGPRQPTDLERIAALEGQAVTLLSPVRQRNAAAYLKHDLAGGSATAGREGGLEQALEQVQRMPADRRDGRLAMLVMHGSDSAPLEKAEAAAQKIEDVEARRQALNWLYFKRGHNAASAGDFDAARKLAERVDALEARSLLLHNIAAEGLKRSDDRQHAEELLSAVVAAARKAPDTEAKARALLGVAHLYARFDYLRGLGVMSEAVDAINKLNDPDLAAASLRMMVQGKNFSTFGGWPMPGFTLGSSFRELGGRELEATLSIANRLGDKYLRAVAVLELVSKCLEESAKPAPPEGKAPRAKGSD